MKRYIHYGHNCFDDKLWRDIKNLGGPETQPQGGFWASPEDAVFGWKQYTRQNQSHKCETCDRGDRFVFTLSKDANVLYIDSAKMLNDLPQRFPPDYWWDYTVWTCLDFEALVQQGYDAVEVNISKDKALEHDLYGWNCDSILIMNKEIIVPLPTQEVNKGGNYETIGQSV